MGRHADPTATRRPARVVLLSVCVVAALLAVGRAGGAITGRLAAFVEGWVPDAG